MAYISEYSHEKRENKKKEWFANCEWRTLHGIFVALDRLSDRKIYKVGYVFTTYFEFQANNSISWKFPNFTIINR